MRTLWQLVTVCVVAALTACSVRSVTFTPDDVQLDARAPQQLDAQTDAAPHFMMPGGTIEVHEFLPLPGM